MDMATDTRGNELNIGWFVSPHGLGHAARTAAVIDAVRTRRPEIRHHLFTTVPADFLHESLPDLDFGFTRCAVDVGMIQINPLVEDVDATVAELEHLPLVNGPELDAVVAKIHDVGCCLIVCDISPVGLAAARRLGLPSVLIENFTWDWVYRAYDDPRLAAAGDRLAEIFDSAALRVQTTPVCRPVESARTVPPVSRRLRRSRTETRRALGIGPDETMVLVSIRGIDPAMETGGSIPALPGCTVVVPTSVAEIVRRSGLVRTPATGGPYHPDLVAASDLVIAKLGYSTVAEAYHGGARLAYLGRPRFPESPLLEAFVRRNLPSVALGTDWLDDPTMSTTIRRLLDEPEPIEARPNGADAAARLILDLADARC